MIAARLIELAGMAMIGDGVLALVEPKGHVQIWKRGPEPWERTMDFFLDRPGMTRALGALEIGLGYWLAAHGARRWDPDVSRRLAS